jgi:hypothetical protein
MITKKSSKKSNIVKNNFTIYQIKKMIGKKLLLIHPSINAPIINQYKSVSKNIKEKILDTNNSSKNLILTATCNNGVLYIFKNAETLLAINSISYKELESNKNIDVNVIIIQHPNLTKQEVKDLI